MKEVGLIGFGNFGRVVHSLLISHFKIYVFDIKKHEKSIAYSSLKECASKDIVITAVPVQYLEKLLNDIKTYIKKDALIFDVSSVKDKPVKLMMEILPRHCGIIGTHPLFGPESIKKIKSGLKIVLCPVRVKDAAGIISFLSVKLGFEVIIMTPEEHDRQMAEVQGLTHFLGKALNELETGGSELKTLSYEHLIKMKDIVRNDTDDLFKTIQIENVFAAGYRKRLIDKLIEIDKRLNLN